jgi:filamentous hemagglutinin
MVEGSPSKIAAHALVGGLKSMAMGGDFRTGALAGGANEALIGYLAELVLPEDYDPNKPGAEQAEANLLAMSQLLGVLTAVVSGSDPRIAADIAANATQNNFLNHTENAERLEAVKGCNNGDMQACARRDELNLLDVNRDTAVWAACDGAATSPACNAARTEAQIARFDLLRHMNTPESQAQLQQDLKDPALMNYTILGELRSIKVLDDAVVRQISTSISQSLFSIGANLTPGVGDVKAFAEAEDAWDYVFASIGLVPGAGDVFAVAMRESRTLLKEGKAQEAGDVLEDLATYVSDAKAADAVASVGGKTCVYNCVIDGVTRYVGITDDIVKRGQAHLREKGIVITKIRGLDNISRADARAVEQTLIDYHGLEKDGGTLINKINSISSIKNPTKYEQGLIRGAELLKKAGYEGF